jgi:hypothetical protein
MKFSAFSMRDAVLYRNIMAFLHSILTNKARSRNYQSLEDGGSTVLRNVGILPHHYTVSQSIRPGLEYHHYVVQSKVLPNVQSKSSNISKILLKCLRQLPEHSNIIGGLNEMDLASFSFTKHHDPTKNSCSRNL